MASSFQHYFSRISNFNYHQQHPAASLQLMDDTRSFCTAFLPPLSPVDKGMLPLLLPLLSNSSIAYHYWERWKDEQDLLVIENADTTMGGGKDWLHSTVSCRRRCHMFISVFLSQRNGSDAIEESTQERTNAIESTQERTYAHICTNWCERRHSLRLFRPTLAILSLRALSEKEKERPIVPLPLDIAVTT
jgi:hypothetical protein